MRQQPQPSRRVQNSSFVAKASNLGTSSGPYKGISVANSERNDLRRSRVREPISQKSVVSNAAVKERIQMRVLWACHCDGHSCEPENRPFFETVQDKLIYTAQHFASTRFGSTKPKSHQSHAMGFGHHPFTTPSVLAYSKLLQTLNKLASLPEDGGANGKPVLSNAGGAYP
uniref:Uncharacterized protein n=1 Tax=Ditylenchus dipsaci TaxID=166011 RepID=A0A915DW65_9BILA